MVGGEGFIVEDEKHMVGLPRSVLHRIVGAHRAYFSVSNCSNPKKRLDRHADMAHHSRPMVSELMCGERLMMTSISTNAQGYALGHDAIGEYAPIWPDHIRDVRGNSVVEEMPKVGAYGMPGFLP